MKPPPFAYRRVSEPEEAVERLTQFGEDAKVLAGGQSLIPMLALRLVRPSVLIDVSRVASLRRVERHGDELRVGALARHRDLLAANGGHAVLARTVPLVGHAPIRTRGTFGGSLAHGDPAAEWPLAAVALDAELVALGPRGVRTIAAADFFHGYLTTALEPDELLVEARLRRPWPGAAVREHSRRHGDFAMAAALAAVDVDEQGRCRDARVALGALADVPLRAGDAERALVGSRLEDEALGEAAEAAAGAVDPHDDAHASGAYRRRLAAVLVRDALEEARERALESTRGPG